MATRQYVAVLLVAVAMLAAGCIATPKIRQAPLSDDIAADALAVALSQLGVPYVWGGQDPSGFDCSGLIIWSYEHAFPRLRLRYASEVVNDTTQDGLWRYNVVRVPPQDMVPGDIVFITDNHDVVTHGGLFIRWVSDGVFEFVNASSYHGEVVIDTWPVDGTKRGQWFVGSGRLQTVL